MSLYVSRESRKSLEKRSPNSTLGLQPPHSQESWGPRASAGNCSITPCTIPFPRLMASSWRRLSLILNASSSPRRFSSQPQPFSLPMAQALDTACTTPAAAMAYANALSLKPAKETIQGIIQASLAQTLSISSLCALLRRKLSHSRSPDV